MEGPDRGGISLKRRLADLVTIFLGVGLAFLAEDWREYRGDRADESAALSSLEAEFLENQVRLAERLANQRKIRGHLQRLDELLDASEEGSVVSIPDTLLVPLSITPTYDPVRGTVDALLASGRIGIVRDGELRSALAGWPDELLDAAADQSDQMVLLTDVVYPFLLESEIPWRDLMVQSNDWFFGRLTADDKLRTTPVRVSAGLKSVVAIRLNNAGRIVLKLDALDEYQAGLLELIQGADRQGAAL